MLVKSPAKLGSIGFFEGTLRKIPQARNEILISLFKEYPVLKSKMSKYFLDEADKGGLYAFIAMLFLCLFLISFINLTRAIFRLMNISSHPLLKNLEKYGTPNEIVNYIDNQISCRNIIQIHNAIFTDFWFLNNSYLGVGIAPYYDIVWVYMSEKTTRYLCVPISWSYTSNIITGKGDTIEVQGSEQNCKELLFRLVQMAPWAQSGYTPALEKQMSGKRRIATVAQIYKKREEILSAP